MLGLPAHAAQEFDHAQGAVGVARVDDDGRGGEPVWPLGEPAGDGVARPLVVEALGVVVLRQEVVVEEDHVVVVRRQKLYGARRIRRNVNRVAPELPCEPLVPQKVVVEEEDTKGSARGERIAEADLVQKTLKDAHTHTGGFGVRGKGGPDAPAEFS